MKDEQLFDLRAYVDQTLLDAYTSYQPKALRFWGNPKKEKSALGLDRTTERKQQVPDISETCGDAR